MLKNIKIENKNIASVALFGSYNTEFWIKGKSDIDILVLLKKKGDVSIEFDIEDQLIPIFQEYFKYDNIHLTFIYMSDFSEELANEYIKSKDKLILDEDKEIDFRLYINKYKRNNEWLEELIKADSALIRNINTLDN